VDNNSRFNMVGPGYFATVGIPVLAGREFTRYDAIGTPKVAVVNQAFAKKFKLGANPVAGGWTRATTVWTSRSWGWCRTPSTAT